MNIANKLKIDFKSRRQTLLLSLGVLLLVIASIPIQLSKRPLLSAQEGREQLPAVEVVTATAGSYRARVNAHGAAEPHYKLALTAKVSGYVSELASDLEPGRRLARDQPLLQLQDSDYRATVAAAEKNLADARVALLEEEREAAQAESAWAMSGVAGEPDSELTLRQPQLRAARATLQKARAELDSARRDLTYTQVAAPFDALVVERRVSPGSFVAAGSELATLYSTDRVELALTLSAGDWSNLPPEEELLDGSWRVQLTSVADGSRWSGYVLRAEQHLDASTRQRALTVALDAPLDQSPALLPGTFVEATIPGRALDGLWQLPGSALSQRGEIWYLSAENTLDRFAAQPLFSDAQFVYVRPPEALAAAPQRVLLHPLNGYLRGMRVEPSEAGAEKIEGQSAREIAQGR
ncbi:efflux RND transporter periplasmic adaptor subunit [Microbulbifer taiwanensis]|uniref:efflux RND transporter periplasmic adaptor subunit n=1 Tax=Microbulbifer taiwanensis TaxID=986746 RepID=UPI00360CD6F9